MAFSDSMFLFEVVVEKLKSYIKCKAFVIKGQFADVFSFELQDPNETVVVLPRKKIRKRKTVRVIKAPPKQNEEIKLQCGQSILLEHNADQLKTRMMDFPIELSLWSSHSPEDKLGFTRISWSQTYLNYLNLVKKNRSPAPVTVSGDYYVFDEVTSKRMATISLKIKLSHLKNFNNQPITSILDNKLQNNIENCTEFVKLSHLKQCINQPITSILDNTLENNIENKTEFTSFIGNKYKKYENIDTGIVQNNIENRSELTSFIGNKHKKYEKIEIGIVKAKYEGSGRKKDKKLNPNKQKTKKTVNPVTFHQETKYIQPIKTAGHEIYSTNKNLVIDNDVRIEEIKAPAKKIVLRRISTSLVNIPKSEPRYENIFDLASTKSCTSTKYDSKLNPYNYIFGDPNQSYGNMVYCVGYFTVQNDTTPSAPSGRSEVSRTSEKTEERYKIRICDSICPGKRNTTETDSQSHISLDLPAERTIDVKCDTVDCGEREHRKTQAKPDERILIGVDRPRITEKVEQVVGGIDAKMKFGDDPCYCTCECTFGFTKKTTYCNVCGGYEIVGEEIVGKDGQLPFPCPIFHKLDKNKSKTSTGSDSKRTMKGSKAEPSKTEPEKSIKGKKKATKDDRFKFNYGYEAPHIGHSHCAMPCRGTLGAVPKNMGWLWTSEDVLGMKVAQGWRPGAVSKGLLRKLKRAKEQKSSTTFYKKLRKAKKRSEVKPGLVISKIDGEYRVEMQMTHENPDGSDNQNYSPLIYKIKRPNNEERLLKRERKTQRLVKEAVGNWPDPFHPEYCERTCLRAYKQAMGILPYDPNNPDCTCEETKEDEEEVCSCCEGDDDDSSDCSSLDLNWEIHFTPPSQVKANADKDKV